MITIEYEDGRVVNLPYDGPRTLLGLANDGVLEMLIDLVEPFRKDKEGTQ